MHISGSTQVFFILGDPVAQVRAPEVYNALFAEHDVDAVLVPLQVAAADLEDFVGAAMKVPNVGGLWLTIPHKQALLPRLAAADAQCRAAGAANAIRRTAGGGLEGALFDGTGFVGALRALGVAVSGRRVLLVGAGGAGTAIAAALAAEPLRELALFDAQPGRAAQVLAQLRATWPAAPLATAASNDPAAFDLVVNATPLGLMPTDPLPFDPQRLQPGACVVDILMKNQPTPLLRACHARGVAAHPGFEMMVQQVPEYLSFFGFGSIAAAARADPDHVRRLFAD